MEKRINWNKCCILYVLFYQISICHRGSIFVVTHNTYIRFMNIEHHKPHNSWQHKRKYRERKKLDFFSFILERIENNMTFPINFWLVTCIERINSIAWNGNTFFYSLKSRIKKRNINRSSVRLPQRFESFFLWFFFL